MTASIGYMPVNSVQETALAAVVEKIEEIICWGYGDVVIRIHGGEIRHVEVTRKAKDAETIKKL